MIIMTLLEYASLVLIAITYAQYAVIFHDGAICLQFTLEIPTVEIE